ncbi:MAG: UTP--glucose-1-phosphate uridylyltransferase [Pseudomonadota bacterium]|nr:UTP--glucose-1-phosphate uridylyltransferase [Pseudomonadota bacterium]
MRKIRKAVFPVAGSGTRFLPATKAMPKELLTVVDKPLVQYAAEEAVAAGIDTLVFVTGRNKRAVEDHFDNNQELEAALRLKGEITKADMVRNILPKGVECIFVRQPEPLGLGHAVLCAERVIGDDPFVVLLADDLLISEGKGMTNNLVQAYINSGKSQLAVMEVEGPSISHYGVVVLGKDGESVTGLVEKPDVSAAPSNLASIGRYVLTSDIFNVLRQQPAGSGGEIQLADAIDRIAQDGKVEIAMFNGKRFDCGSMEGYVRGFSYVASRIS